VSSDRVVLDRESFKALSSKTRIAILKALDEKRMTITQLSEKLGISKPALLKHMEGLIEAKLVRKEERERKWIYYDLSFKGRNVLHPERIKVTVLLSAAVLSLAGGIAMFLNSFRSLSQAGGTGGLGTENFDIASAPATEGLLINEVLFIAAIALIVLFSILLTSAILIKKKYANRALP
jgi:DNA-binding transcriptional ArsR family regulator